jgi:Domain of unknown function (DUF4129)
VAALRRRSVPPPRALALLLLMAVGFGLLAAMLAGPLPAVPPPASTSSGGAPYPALPLIGDAIVVLICGYLAFQVYVRVRGGRMPIPFQFALYLVALLVAIALLAIAFHAFGPPVPPGGTGAAGGTNNTTDSPGGHVPTLPLGNGSNLLLPDRPIPGVPSITWGELGLLALAAIVAGAVYWVYVASVPPRVETPTGRAPDAERLRAEFARSLLELEAQEGADPREVILRLYARLLLALRPQLGPLAEYTPREIARVVVGTYGAGPDSAGELTALFEEARYSHHPLDREHAARARRALEGLLGELRAWSESRERRAADPLRRSSSHRPPPTEP